MLQVIRFYFRWLTIAFRHSIGIGDGIAFLLGSLIPPMLRFIPDLEQAMVELAWQIPLGACSAIVLGRLILAPYWIYKDSKEAADMKIRELESKTVKDEWEYRRQRLMEIRGPKLETLPKLLSQLLGAVDEVVNNLSLDAEGQEQIKKVIEEIEIQQAKYNLTDLLSDALQSIIGHCLDESDMSIEGQIRADKECYRLLDEISNCLEIGDGELTRKMKVYFSSFFNGYSVIFLLDNCPEFAHKYGNTVGIRAIRRIIRSSIETRLTQVNKRIEQLRAGDEGDDQ